MNFGASALQNAQNIDDLEDLDELLDFNSPPICSSNICSLTTPSYPSQLILSQNIRAKTDTDSGFSFTQSSFNQSQSFHRRFAKTERQFSSQSTASVSSSDSYDLSKQWSTQKTDNFRKEEKRSESKRPRTSWINADNNDSFSLTQTPSFLQSSKSQFQFLEGNRASLGQDTIFMNNIPNDLPEESPTSFRMNELSQEIENSQKECRQNGEFVDESGEFEKFENEDKDKEETDDDQPSSDFNKTIQNDEHQPIVNLDRNQTLSVIPGIQPILDLFTKIKSQYSDCAFVHALATHTCKDIYPKDSYISLKTALLLSIVSGNNQDTAQPISIMTITRDTAATSSIMGSIGNLARRFICISDDLKFTGKCSQTTTIEANSLLMARNGVCFVGDWLGLKPASLKYLQNVIDSGRVTADPRSNIEYALKCTVWMYWSCSAKKMKQNQTDLAIISKLFGIPVVLDDTPSVEVIDFIIAKYSGNELDSENEADNEIDDNVIKTFLKFVSKFPTEFDDEALAMLKVYFMVTRAIRPNILSPKSFDILQRLSECHAKLCLRRNVLKIDVIFSIELFEQFVLNFFSGQVMTKPIPNSSATSFQQVDENMSEFAQWLEGYLSRSNENINSFLQENL